MFFTGFWITHYLLLQIVTANVAIVAIVAVPLCAVPLCSAVFLFVLLLLNTLGLRITLVIGVILMLFFRPILVVKHEQARTSISNALGH